SIDVLVVTLSCCRPSAHTHALPTRRSSDLVPGVFTFYPISSRNISHTLDLVLKFLTNLNIPSGQSRPGNRGTLSHRQRRIRNTTVHVFHDSFRVIPKTLNLGFRSINTNQSLETQRTDQPTSGGNSPTNRHSDLLCQVHANIANALTSCLKLITNTAHPVASIRQLVTHTVPHRTRVLGGTSSV